MDKKYNHTLVEQGREENWRAQNDEKIHCQGLSSFTILLPPPNVTGKLHLGHAWDCSLQDAIIRYKALNGFNTLFIPGTDHAGIATQAKVEEKLRETNITKDSLGRDKFIATVWDWKDKYANEIHKQWKKLGLILDYKHERFTLDKKSNFAVNEAFIKMYKDGLIYRGERAISWDCKLHTSLSDIEVSNRPTKSKMYYLKYNLLNGQGFIEVATTRVETLFSDVAIAVNPTDKRYKKLIGEAVINPLTNQNLPIISDKCVDKNFGSGAMKVSAHATIDIDIIKKHGLEIRECIDKDGKMKPNVSIYKGMDRFEARNKIANFLESVNALIKIENLTNNVAYSERSNTIIETLVSPQWYVKTKPLAKLVLNNLRGNKAVKFFPSRFNKTLIKWMNEIEDWNISRQLWWGHQIPVWYKDKEMKVQVTDPGKGWVQDPDVLDTWFSSALAPFSFLGWPDKAELLNNHYPTSLLITGYDIIFFWVARMYFQGLYLMKEVPFKEVLIHGLIRDEDGNKMSKSLGNGIDPMELIDKYGTDSLRWFLLTNSSPGQDLKYSDTKLLSAWNFNNKIWNIARFILENEQTSNAISQHDLWIQSKLNLLNKELTKQYNKYEFTLAKKAIYNFVYNEFSSWYIEMSKEKFNKEFALKVLSDFLLMLYPLMPFITDYLYEIINRQSIMKSHWPSISKNEQSTKNIDEIIQIVKVLRDFRIVHNIPNKEAIYYCLTKANSIADQAIIKTLTNAVVKKNKDAVYPLSKANNVYILMTKEMKEAQEKKNKIELEKLESEIKRSKAILNNKKFLANANPAKVKEEKEKYANYLVRYNELKK